MKAYVSGTRQSVWQCCKQHAEAEAGEDGSQRAPPASDSTTLSVSNCRTIRPRLAPRAARMPNSWERAPR